jgi:uncharacterized SAM-binding protein YcdF (DUF218 family)
MAKSTIRGRTRRAAWRLRFTTAVAVLGAVAGWAYGLFLFAVELPRAVEQPETATEAIVVLTGGSERLAEGLRLLTADMGRKLFISGVYRGVDVAELLSVARQGPTLTDRIVLGHDAGDTSGNARETAQWMAQEGFSSLRLVTAGYHMPRGRLEFRRAMPEVALIAHPVFPANVHLDDWWRWPGTATLLATEYTKYLLTRLRVSVVTLWQRP